LSTYGVSGVHTSEARNEATKLDQDCEVRNKQDEDARNKQKEEEEARNKQKEEEAAWQSAQRCAASAEPCGVKQCYEPYQTKYCPAGAHCSQAKAEVARALQACKPPPPPPPPPPKPSTEAAVDGRYSARSLPACGAKVDYSIVVDVRGGRISWEHEFLGVRYRWEGTIDAYGKVTAKVANFPGYTATGQFDKDRDKEIQMKYPHCDTGTVPLEIRAKIQ
jgi:hypothetical protein